MEITILVQSRSREEPYAVAVSSTESGLSIFCDCPAGKWGKYCKHKMAILLADEGIIYDEEQNENFKKVTEWISESGYSGLVTELRTNEKALEVAKKNVKNQKEMIARLMREGLK
ncbi:MAG: SWIM zinc finger domain-containing protein [Candidatus Thiodiazotropha sp. (ex Troendleina suluensis)]|nr:SWIM zinc finger domain-containing protein [Candidatus Thiodiazotropha sp. (ex Troendleina suluensis)]